jgi:hypothetical protein
MTDGMRLDDLLDYLGHTDWHEPAHVGAVLDLLEEEGRRVEARVMREVDGWRVRTIDGRPRVVGSQQLRLAFDCEPDQIHLADDLLRELRHTRLRLRSREFQLAKGRQIGIYGYLPLDTWWLKVSGLTVHVHQARGSVDIDIERLPLLRTSRQPVEVDWI